MNIINCWPTENSTSLPTSQNQTGEAITTTFIPSMDSDASTDSSGSNLPSNITQTAEPVSTTTFPGSALPPSPTAIMIPAPTTVAPVDNLPGAIPSGSTETLLLGMVIGGAIVFAFFGFIFCIASLRQSRRSLPVDSSVEEFTEDLEAQHTYTRYHCTRPPSTTTTQL